MMLKLCHAILISGLSVVEGKLDQLVGRLAEQAVARRDRPRALDGDLSLSRQPREKHYGGVAYFIADSTGGYPAKHGIPPDGVGE